MNIFQVSRLIKWHVFCNLKTEESQHFVTDPYYLLGIHT